MILHLLKHRYEPALFIIAYAMTAVSAAPPQFYTCATSTGSSISIAVPISINPKIDGVPLGVYDEIGAFSKAGLCVGEATWDSVSSQPLNVVGQNSQSSTADGLHAGDTIYFRVWHYATRKEALAVVIDSIGSNVYAPSCVAVISSLAATSSPIQDPALSSPASGATSQPLALTLYWGSVTGATGYGVQVSADGAFGSTVTSQTGLAALSKAISGLSYNGIYYWRANASSAAATSFWTGIWSFYTLATPGIPNLSSPTNGFTASVGKTTPLTLGWGSVAAADSYTLQVSTISTFSSTFVNQPGITAVNRAVANWPASAVYYWRVNATNAAGTGAWSSSWSINVTVPVLSDKGKAGIVPSLSFLNGSLHYALPATAKVDISLFDILGKKALGFNFELAAGSYRLPLNSAALPSGRYLLRFNAGELSRDLAITVTR